MIWLVILSLSIDTLRYDDGVAEGFYIVGDYKNDKFGVQFSVPYPHYKVLGVLVFADSPEGFNHAILCPDSNGEPDTLNPWVAVDSVYSAQKEWMFTPIELELADSGALWFILRMSASPGVGGDTNNPSLRSWCYSDSCGWKLVTECNWLIRLVVKEEPGYYEDFSSGGGGFIGDWEFGVPSIVPLPKNNCFATRLHTNYPNNTYLQLESPWIPVSSYGLQQPTLVFLHYYDTERPCDGGNVKISKDTLNWVLISPLTGYDDTLHGAHTIDGEPGFSGESGGWRKGIFFLPLWDSVKIRWCFGSDIVGNDPGWFVDEVKIGERPPHDVAPVSINLRQIVPPETTVIPASEIRNLGIYSEGVFPVKCVIESCGIPVYEDTMLVDYLPPCSTITAIFEPFYTSKKGVTYEVKVYSEMIGDEHQANDTLGASVLTFPLIDSLTAGFTTLPPLIDGIIDSIEWKDATLVDGSDVLGVDSVDPIESCNLYFMNCSSFFYIGCKADSIKELRIYLDESCNGEWEQDSSEGFYWITQDDYKFQDMYYHQVYSLPDSLKSMGPEGIELAIPIGVTQPYEITPTCSLGCFIYATASGGYVGWWPQYIGSANYNNPANYAHIKVTGVGVEEDATPRLVRQDVRLEVWPNPFRGKAVIRVQIQEVSHRQVGMPTSRQGQRSVTDKSGCRQVGKVRIELRIYDLSGRLVKCLPLTNPKRSSGRSPITSVVWDASNLPSGIYFLVYKSGDTKITKKLTLIR